MSLKLLAHVGRGRLTAVKKDPLSAMEPGFEELLELSNITPGLFVYFLISAVTDGEFGGIEILEPETGGNHAFVIQKVPEVQAIREQAIPFTSPDLVQTFSQSVGNYVLHAYLDLVTPCVAETAWQLSSPTRLLPGLFWWRGGGADKEKVGRKRLLCPWENDDRSLVALRDTRLGTSHLVYAHDGQLELLQRFVKRSCGGVTTALFEGNAIKQGPAVRDLSASRVPWSERSDQGVLVWLDEIGANNDFVSKTYRTLFQAAVVKTVVGFGEIPSALLDFVEAPGSRTRVRVLANSKVLLLGEKNFDHRLHVAEACELGVPIVLPDQRWARALVPVGYPLLYGPNDSESAAEKVELAVSADGQRYGDELVVWAQERFKKTPLVDRLRALFEASSGDKSFEDTLGSRFVQRAQDMIAGKDSFQFSWFLKETRRGGIAKGFRGRSQADNGGWYAILAALGYVDRGGHDPVLVKE